MTLQSDAQAALEKSDITVIRCYETGTQVTQDWVNYRESLREIVSGISSATELPAQPEYPLVAQSTGV